MTKPSAQTKAELYAMLAEAIRNTQPQQVCDEQPEPVSNTRAAPKRKTQPRDTRPALKRTAKIKRVRR